jgi:leader peptidase (prepilin peptidase)/N-methyltransferase
MIDPMLDSRNWTAVPFHFWSAVFFVFGSMVGSFLNVCIHRLPLEQSIVSPPSHCPHCKYSIPWYLNIPLVTWLYLRGKCRNCGAPISARYFLVELLTASLFLACWVKFGLASPWLSLIYCGFLALLIAATFIDAEHLIIPDEIAIGGAAAGFVLSFFVPALHGEISPTAAMKASLLGMAAGAGVIYAIVRVGKLVFGRHKLMLEPGAKVVFNETAIEVSGKTIPYEDVFYRPSDTIVVRAHTVELVDRGYEDVEVRLSQDALRIGEEKLDPATVPWLEATASRVVLPREAMGLGDVKFMAMIGAFLGWQAVLFSLMLSSMLGAVVGLTLIALGKRAWSSRLPYGPYIAVAAAIWPFYGKSLVALGLTLMAKLFWGRLPAVP